MLPLPRSPSIDAAGSTKLGPTDLRRIHRLLNHMLDIGAVEFQGDNVVPFRTHLLLESCLLWSCKDLSVKAGYEAEINTVVYRPFDLTDEEITLIESTLENS